MLQITEDDVKRLMPMSRALELVENAAREQALGNAVNAPRVRVQAAAQMLHILPAASSTLGQLGLKAYASGPKGVQFYYFLFDENGLRATIEADTLGRIRTGAASGIATKFLTPETTHTLAIIGAGNQAFTQIEAVSSLRNVAQVKIHSRTPERRAELAARVTRELGLSVTVCETAEAAIAESTIITTITSSAEPLFAGARVPSNAHINAVGSNRRTNREIDDETLRRARRVIVEDVAQAKIEAGDLLRAENFDWARVETFADLVSGAGRLPAEPDATKQQRDLTIFESLGIGLWDLALAADIADRY